MFDDIRKMERTRKQDEERLQVERPQQYRQAWDEYEKVVKPLIRPVLRVSKAFAKALRLKCLGKNNFPVLISHRTLSDSCDGTEEYEWDFMILKYPKYPEPPCGVLVVMHRSVKREIPNLTSASLPVEGYYVVTAEYVGEKPSVYTFLPRPGTLFVSYFIPLASFSETKLANVFKDLYQSYMRPSSSC